jgi:hypothetical protein
MHQLVMHEEVSIMGCLAALFARLALLFVWVSTPLVNRAFHGGWLLPLLGIIFLPITTLVYVLVYSISSGVTGRGWLWVVLAFLLDLGAHSSGAYANRHRFPGYQAPGE